jgi:hypothetical protein
MMRELTEREWEDLNSVFNRLDATLDQATAYAIDQAVARATAWQYIATAPRDEVIDLMGEGGARITDCLWNDTIRPGGAWSRPYQPSKSGGLVFVSPKEKITHWMPIPNPPLTKGDDNG